METVEEIAKKIKLDLQESIDLEIALNEIRIDILKAMKRIIESVDDVSNLSKALVVSDTYDHVLAKYEGNAIFSKVPFKACFLKIAGDCVNQIMFIQKI